MLIMELGRSKGFVYFGTMGSGIVLFLFFTLPYWHIFAPINKIEGVVGIILSMAGVFLTIVGFILVMEIMIESRFRGKAKIKYPHAPRETYFDED